MQTRGLDVHCLSRFFEWDRKSSHKQPYFIYFADRAPTAEMQELVECGGEEEEEEEEEKCGLWLYVCVSGCGCGCVGV